MRLEEYLDALNLELVVFRYANQHNRWCAKFGCTDTKDNAGDALITSTFGDGISPHAAIIEYLRKINGKILVVNAHTNQRREYAVPQGLVFE